MKNNKFINRGKALSKILNLIDSNYGGIISEEDWANHDIKIYQLQLDAFTNKLYICNSAPIRFRNPISFYSYEDAQKFLNDIDNISLLEIFYS